MIELSEKYLINTGTNRACYEHPEDKNKCIKIIISGNNKETSREIKYYKYLEKKNISWNMLSKYYGNIITNYGIGEVVELIRDYNGSISKELAHYIRTEEIDNKRIDYLLNKLNNYLINEVIIVKDLNSVNIVYQKFSKNNEGRLVIIDGIGSRGSIFSFNYFKIKKIKKIWEHFTLSLKT